MTAYRWFRAELLPVPGGRLGRLVLVDDPLVPVRPPKRTAVYTCVSSADQNRGVRALAAAATDDTVVAA